MAYTSSQVVQAVPTGINSALVFIRSQVNITNCFSSTYESYLIIGRNITGPGDSYAFDFRLGVSGTPNTASDYLNSAVETAYGAGTYVEIGQCGTSDVNNFQMQITAPQLAQQTFFTASWQSLYLTGTSRMRNGYHQSTIQFTELVRSGASDFATSKFMDIQIVRII
jgi:hypothetical protein